MSTIRIVCLFFTAWPKRNAAEYRTTQGCVASVRRSHCGQGCVSLHSICYPRHHILVHVRTPAEHWSATAKKQLNYTAALETFQQRASRVEMEKEVPAWDLSSLFSLPSPLSSFISPHTSLSCPFSHPSPFPFPVPSLPLPLPFPFSSFRPSPPNIQLGCLFGVL